MRFMGGKQHTAIRIRRATEDAASTLLSNLDNHPSRHTTGETEMKLFANESETEETVNMDEVSADQADTDDVDEDEADDAEDDDDDDSDIDDDEDEAKDSE